MTYPADGDLPLHELRECFEGVIPSPVATLDADGLPNVTYLSQVHYVDETHVALSNQFLSKTAANVQATGRASILAVSGRTGEQFRLDLEFDQSLATGEVFERMAAQLQAIATQHGMADVMALRSAELYRVARVRRVPNPLGADPPPRLGPVFEGGRLSKAARLAGAIAAEVDADAMIDRALSGLIDDFGFEAAMILSLDETAGRLTALASRGFPTGGAGAEVALGEGAIGIAGAAGRPVRLSDMSRGRRMVAAILAGETEAAARTIPLPGLTAANSQLAVPMISRGATRGVLFVESTERFLFQGADEDALTLIADQLAAGLRLAEIEAADVAPAPALQMADGGSDAGAAFQVKYYLHDDSLFIDGDYLIKGVPGRLLMHFLAAYARNGRRDFTNREIRLEPSLRLPGLKDNLETRLILLRRRLEEKAAPVRLARPGRGQIRLELTGAPSLEIVEA